MNYDLPFLELARVASLLMPGRRLAFEPYAYPFDFGAAAGTATLTATRTTKANCNFLATHGVFSAFQADGSFITALTDSYIQIEDAGSVDKFFNVPMQVLAVFSGYSNDPVKNMLPFPRLIPGNSTLTATLDWSQVNGDTLGYAQLALHGVLLYDYE